jgi:uncharacterized protein
VGLAFADNPADRRYELYRDGALAAWAEYRPAGDSVILAHTEVAEGHEGEGAGGEVVRRTLEALRAQEKTVIPTCPFAAAWIGRHPEWIDAVDPALRGQFR